MVNYEVLIENRIFKA